MSPGNPARLEPQSANAAFDLAPTTRLLDVAPIEALEAARAPVSTPSALSHRRLAERNPAICTLDSGRLGGREIAGEIGATAARNARDLRRRFWFPPPSMERACAALRFLSSVEVSLLLDFRHGWSPALGGARVRRRFRQLRHALKQADRWEHDDFGRLGAVFGTETPKFGAKPM